MGNLDQSISNEVFPDRVSIGSRVFSRTAYQSQATVWFRPFCLA